MRNAIFLHGDEMRITFNDKEGTKTIAFDDVEPEVSNEASGSALDCLVKRRGTDIISRKRDKNKKIS